MGEDYYYRVDFTLESELPIDIAYMPLYRNHKYVVTVTDAEGIGYPDFCGGSSLVWRVIEFENVNIGGESRRDKPHCL